MIPQFGQHDLTYPQIILGSAALTGALAELTSFGSTRFQLVAVYLITAVVLTTLRLTNSAIETEPAFSHPNTRATKAVTAIYFGFAMLLVTRSILAVLHSNEPRNLGGFGTIAGEDNAAWLSILTNWYHETTLVSAFGDTMIVFLVGLVAAVRALSLGRLGVSTVGDLVIHLNLIYAVIHVLAAAAYLRLWRQLIRTGTPRILPLLVIVACSTGQQFWLYTTRDYGHLTSILSCQLLSYFALKLVFKRRLREIQTGLVLAMAAGSCFIWLPLKPVGILLILFASLSFVSVIADLSRRNRRGKILFRTLLIMGAAGLSLVAQAGISILSRLAADARDLIMLGGGTPQLNAGHFIAVCCVSAFLFLGTQRGLLRGAVGLPFLFVGITIAYSFAMTGASNYGSDKLVWWFLGFLFTFGGHALAISSTEATTELRTSGTQLRQLSNALALAALVASLGLIALENTSFSPFSPPEPTWVAGTESATMTWWGASDEVLASPVSDGPLGCVEISQNEYLIPTWDGYLCSRMLGWSMAWDRKGKEPDVQFRQFALMNQTAEATLVNLAETDFRNLKRPIVLLKDGNFYEQIELLDFLSQKTHSGE